MRVAGQPVSQGSKRFLGNGRMVESNAATLRPWRADVKAAAVAARGETGRMGGPVAVRLAFTFARPAKHHVARRKDRPLRDDAPRLVAIAPDIDKVARAVLDALTDAGWWHDDAQVSMLEVRKVYGEEPGVHAQAWKV